MQIEDIDIFHGDSLLFILTFSALAQILTFC